MDVEHQAMAVFRDRGEREGLRLHLGLEVEHHAHDAGTVARHAQTFDVRIVAGDFPVQLGERRRHFSLEIEHQPLGILDGEDLVLHLRLGFEREARVVARGPDAAGNNLGLSRS